MTLGIDSGLAFVSSERGVTSPDCTETDPNRVDCDPRPLFVINFLGFNDDLDADQVTGAPAVEARGGGGDDTLEGTQNADRLFGEDGGDRLESVGGNDVLDGGAGDDSFDDGAGDDAVSGGPKTTTSRSAPAATRSAAATARTPPTSVPGSPP